MAEDNPSSRDSSLIRLEAQLKLTRAKLAEKAARLEEEARGIKHSRGHITKKPKKGEKSAQSEPEPKVIAEESQPRSPITAASPPVAKSPPPRPGSRAVPPQSPSAEPGSTQPPALEEAPSEAPDVEVKAEEAKALPPRPRGAAPPVPMRPAARPVAKPEESTRPPQRAAETSSPATAPQAVADPPDNEPYLGLVETCKQWIAHVGGAYLASMLFHAALFIGLFLFLGARYIHQKITEGTSFNAVEIPQLEDQNLKPLELDQPFDGEINLNALVAGDKDSKVTDGAEVTQTAQYFDASPTFEEGGGGLKSEAVDAPQLGGASFDFSTLRSGSAMKGPGGLGAGGGEGDSAGVGGAGTGPLGGRSKGSRKATAQRKGGSGASEAAVESALKWIAAHQNADGSWSYDHRLGGKCQCGNPGSSTGSFGSTGLALLPFLSAGYTQKEGKYKQNVAAGLKYLVGKMEVDAARGTGKMFGGNEHMYAHGLATIALTEAYGMTKDSKLRAPAQAALNWIIASQSQDRNFWGYEGGGGDTSVSGWQIMALKSGKAAYLNVPTETWPIRVSKGLDGVQSEYGAFYGYGGPGNGPATTAVGLLSRMYLGANQNNPALAKGMTFLAQTGPDLKNMYYTYYANQAMFQYTNGEGPQWQRWNLLLRDGLIKTQSTQGHEAGSWSHCLYIAQGGRLYSTSLCCMSLQVYYRYMSVYQRGAGKAGHGGGPRDANKEEILGE